ncbi:unnamed protein product [Phaeothamnion confervicola]
MKVVAQLRNAGVPYTSPFNLKPFPGRPVQYMSKENADAESRQRAEDAAIDRIMEGEGAAGVPAESS